MVNLSNSILAVYYYTVCDNKVFLFGHHEKLETDYRPNHAMVLVLPEPAESNSTVDMVLSSSGDILTSSLMVPRKNQCSVFLASFLSKLKEDKTFSG